MAQVWIASSFDLATGFLPDRTASFSRWTSTDTKNIWLILSSDERNGVIEEVVRLHSGGIDCVEDRYIELRGKTIDTVLQYIGFRTLGLTAEEQEEWFLCFADTDEILSMGGDGPEFTECGSDIFQWAWEAVTEDILLYHQLEEEMNWRQFLTEEYSEHGCIVPDSMHNNAPTAYRNGLQLSPAGYESKLALAEAKFNLLRQSGYWHDDLQWR